MRRLAVMRPRDKLEGSAALAHSFGFEPVCASPLEIVTNDDGSLDRVLNDLGNGRMDIIILTSSTGVSAFLEMADKRLPRQETIELLNTTKVVAIGPLTARALKEVGVERIDLPTEHTSLGIVEMLREEVRGSSICVLRSDHGEPVLVTGLRDAGATVSEVIVYRLIPIDTDALEKLVAESLAGRIDCFAFTSALSAQSFIEAAERHHSQEEVIAVLHRAVVAAMGPPTKTRLESMGVRVDVVPASATFEGMLQALSEHLGH